MQLSITKLTLILGLTSQAMANFQILPCKSLYNKEECLASCVKAITSFNECAGLKDCVCQLVDKVDTDLSTCKACILYFPDLDHLVSDIVGNALLGCNYATPTIGPCPSFTPN